MKKKGLCLLAAVLCVGLSHADEAVVASPDGLLSVEVSVEDGMPKYGVKYDGVVFLEESPLGMVTNIGDFSVGMRLGEMPQPVVIDETYALPDIKQSKVHYVATEQVFPFTDATGKKVFDVVFRVGNHDIAFKYRMAAQGETRCCVVQEERTGFKLPAGATSFLCPQSAPMGGFARTSPSYETPYTADAPLGQNGWGEGYTFPCLFRNGDNGWVLISETGVNGAYCGCRLLGKDGGLYVIGFPQEGECNGNGTSAPGIPLPGETPWRTLTIGRDLAPIVQTTVPFDVVHPLYEPSVNYSYGRGTWSWIIKMDESVNYEEQLRYIDFTAAMGYETVLIDNYWDTQIGRDRMEQLARYAAEKHVGLFLWYSSNGYWNDAPQTPRNVMNNIISRRKEMAWLRGIGVKGIKVDFFGGDKQMTMQLYEDILADANDFGLQVIFHGCTLPRGWERMYPNYVSSEAVLASENLHFSQGSCDAEAFNATIHPFVRNAVGSMDFGGSALNRFYNTDNLEDERSTRRVTSDVFALATAVLFQSGRQHFALAPNNLTDAPGWAVDFMKQVPSVWDEVRFIAGYPGKYVVLARRHADKWYVVAVNARQETLKLKVELPMFPAGTMLNCYRDDDSLRGEHVSVRMGKKQMLELKVPCNGGCVLTN